MSRSLTRSFVRPSRAQALLCAAALGFIAHSPLAHAVVSTTTVSFQNDGVYTGTIDKRVRGTFLNPTTGAVVYNPLIELGADLPQYFVDGLGTNTNGVPNSPDETGLVRFDGIVGFGAGQIPAGATILSAKFSLTTGTTSNNAQSPGPWGVHASNVAWDAATPASAWSATGPATFNGSISRAWSGFADPVDQQINPDQTSAAEVRGIVQNWVSGSSANNGFVVNAGRNGNTTDGWQINTTSHPEITKRPKLEVTYTTAPINTQRFQEGVNGYVGTTMGQLLDSWDNNGTRLTANQIIDGSTLNQAFVDGEGFNTTTLVKNSADDQALIKFDNFIGTAAGQVAPDAEVVQAYVTFTTGEASADARTTGGFSLHPMRVDWDLDTADATKPSLFSEFGVTGPKTTDTVPGTTTPAIGDSLGTLAGMTIGSKVSLDITDLVKAWLDGSQANYGLSLQTDLTTDGWQLFFNGATDPTLRPELVILTVGAADSIWANTAGGDWMTAANWQGGNVPDAAGRTAIFGSSIVADSTIVLDADKTIGNLRFDNVARYTLAGPGTLTLERAGAASSVQVLSGNHTIATNVSLKSAVEFDVAASWSLSISGNLAQASGSSAAVTKLGAGTLTVKNVRAASLAVTGGSVVVAAANVSDATSVVGSLSIAVGASLDLQDNALVVDYASGGASPLADVQLAIREGRLVGSTADAAYTLGYAEASSLTGVTIFAGVTLDDSMVAIDLALKGDFNLDKTVNFDDLLKLAANYNNLSGSATWTQGDSTHDGIVNFDDLLQLAANYNQVAAGSVGGDWALALATVPEPSSLMLAGVVAGATLGRRRR